MAFARYLRFRMLAAATLAVFTISSPTTASADETFAGDGYGWGRHFVIVYDAVDAFPAAIFADIKADRRIASEYQAFQPSAVKECASRSAVRPTALTGWRSGRTRYLAS